MNYYDGQIITDHTAFANWSNANGNKFYDESNGDGTYTVHENVAPEPTVDELKATVRQARNNLLDQTDKYMISDFPISDEDRYQMKLYRQYLRDYTEQNNWWESVPDGFADWRANIKKVDEILKESTQQPEEPEK